MERHTATVGVFGIPEDNMGRGLESKRADGKGINAIGGQVDPEDIAKGLSLTDVLRREFREEAGVEIDVTEDRPLGVFPNASISDIAILYPVKIISGTLKPSKEAIEHLWMNPYEVRCRAEMYDSGNHASGLLSGKGKRQWNMARAFFLQSSNPEYRLSALYNLALELPKNGNQPGSIVIYKGAAYVVMGVRGRWLDPNLAPFDSQIGLIPDWLDNQSLKMPAGYETAYENWMDTGYDLYEQVVLRKI